MMKKLLILSWVLIHSVGLSAQVLLEGKVLGEDDGQPLIGAHIYLLSDWQKGAITDVEGEFSLTLDTLNDSDSLLVSFMGYQERIIAARVVKDRSAVTLRPSRQMTEAVVVSAENLIAEEFSIEKINKLEIYKNPSSKADALLAVNALASATTLDETANVSFRGSSPAQTGIFLNQVPIYDYVRFSQLNGLGTLSFFNTDLLKNVQVFPGNPPLEFGNTSSGLVALQTEDELPGANQQQVVLSLASVGASMRQRIGEKQAIMAYSNYQLSGLFRSLNQTALEDILKFNSVDLGIHYVNHLSNRDLLKVFNYTLLEGYDFNFTSPSFDGIFRQRKKRNFTIGNLIHRFEQSSLAFNAGVSFSAVDFGFSRTDIEIASQDYFFGVNYQWEGTRLGLKAGMALDDRSFEYEGTTAVHFFALGEGHPVATQRLDNQRQVLDAYVYLKYDLSDQWVGGLAVRKNIPLRDQKSILSRQANLSYQINEVWNVKAAFGIFYKFLLPQGSETNFLIKTTQGSVDLKRQRGPHQLAFSVFTKDSCFPDQQIQTHGVELSLDTRVGQDITVNASYTFLEARVTADEMTYAGQFDMDYFLKGGIEWNFLDGWTMGARWLFRPGTRYQPVIAASWVAEFDAYEPQYGGMAERDRLTPYRLIDLNLSKLMPVSEELTIVAFLSASNVADFRNVRDISYNRDYSASTDQLFNRRTVYFGAILNFL